jgi:glycosyltransferase involved in cell wall biosynthesis
VFSVIIPLYNKAPYIRRTIDSVLNQSYTEYEIIVINDGSSDGGEEIVKREYGDQILFIHQANQGVSVARNTGIGQAKYSWIAFLDADDYWHPEYLSQIHRAIKAHSDILVFGTSYTSNSSFPVLSSRLPFIVFNNYFKEAIRNTYFFTSATVINKDFFYNSKGFDSQLTLGEDLDFLFRVNLQCEKVYYLAFPLVYYSQEDEFSEVRKNHLIENSLVSKIFSYQFNDRMIPSQWDDFTNFRVKWVLFNLFPYFKDLRNAKEIKKILGRTKGRFFLVRMFYLFPFSILAYVFRSVSFSKLFRNYMKFCFRYIYT